MIDITLFRRHVNDIGTWRITGDTSTGIITILHAQVDGGSEVKHVERVTTNQSGRSLSDQTELRVKSRVSRMLDRGYKFVKEDANASTSNQLGLKRPMLAQQFDKVRSIDYRNAVLQKKFDGHRCLITKHDGKLIAYSRQGKVIDTIDHVTDRLDYLPEGFTTDGELYSHGVPLQTIASWVKRKQENTKRLYYVIYDIISDDSFQDRQAELRSVVQNDGPIFVHLGIPYESDEQMREYHRKVVVQGFEGLILRTDDRRYEDGVRSSSLIKIKQFHEMEVTVKGVRPSKENWAVLDCETPDGKPVACSAPGTVDEKRSVYEHMDRYIGRKLTIQYSVLTNDGVPFHPSALRWRVDI